MPRDDSWRLVQPNYTIRRYTDNIYKVCYFPFGAPSGLRDHTAPHEHYDKKLDNSISRSRRILLEKGLCNDWEFFCTFTLDNRKFNRSDLSGFNKCFSQFIRDFRKRKKLFGDDSRVDFLLVPELHSDGHSWHMHGFFSGIGNYLVSFQELLSQGVDVPYYLAAAGFYNWVDYQNKFGFCSFAPVRNKVAAAFYITKYLYKDLSNNSVSVGKRTIFSSTGLNVSSLHGEIYGHSTYLDQFLSNDYEFCKTGFTHSDHYLDWSFGLDLMDFEPLDISTFNESDSYVDDFVTFTQLAMEDFSNEIT